MKTHALHLGILAATCIAFSGIARAQAITISDDTPSWGGSVNNFSGTGNIGQGEGEAITNAIAIESVTYTFASTQLTSTVGGTLAASLVQWNTGNGSFTTVTSLGTVNIPDPKSWTQTISYNQGAASTTVYEQSFSLSFTNTANLNPTDTYVVLLTNTSGTGLTFGLGSFYTTLTGTGTADLVGGPLESGAGNTLLNIGSNWTFSDVSFVPNGNALPGPEATTVAAWAGVILVAGLVFFRLRQRQGAEAVPAFATIA